MLDIGWASASRPFRDVGVTEQPQITPIAADSLIGSTATTRRSRVTGDVLSHCLDLRDFKSCGGRAVFNIVPSALRPSW
jgi:hypothetical protein